MRVVACAPVPNACAGSMTTSATPSSATGACHGARTWIRPPTVTGRWNTRQRPGQSSATSLVATSTSAPPAAAPRSGSAGTSPGGPQIAYSTTASSTSRSSTPAGASASSSASTTSASARRTRSARRITAAPLGADEALELADERLVGADVVVGHRVGELLDELALLARQTPRRDDVGDDAQVAAAPRAAQPRHAVAAHDEHLARLRAGRDVDLHLAVERRRRQLRPQRRQRRGDVEHGDEVVAVAQEALVGLDAHEHVQVARRPTALAGVTAPAEPDPLAVGDAARHVDAQRAPAHLAPAAVAVLARLGGHLALAVADVAGRLAHDLPERRAAHRLQDAHAAAALARDDRRARLGAVAVTDVAEVDRLEAELDARAGRRVGERDLDLHPDVAALRGAGRLAHAAAATAEAAPERPAEERVEEVGDRAEALEIRRVAARAQAVVAVAVVQRAALGIVEDLVGLGRLLELLLGVGVVAVDVG